MARPRIYLTGAISVERDARLVEERHFPGRQGRLAFVFLTSERHRSIGRDELVDVLWSDAPPPGVDSAMAALLSKLRAVLRRAGLAPADAAIDARSGGVQLRLPSAAWVDLEAAADAIDEAEGALRAGDTGPAWSAANVAVTIGRRSFLASEEAPWIEARRTKLRATLVRGLQCLSDVSAGNGESSLAVQYAKEIVALEPFQETAYQHVMRLHAQMGNRAEALRVFGQCRQLLREELGTSPSPQTAAVFLEILRAGE